MIDFKRCKNKDLVESEAALRAGDWDRCFSLRDLVLSKSKLPQDDRLYLANLCRRTGLPDQNLKLLMSSVVHEKSSSQKTPNAEVIAEYSGALIQLGALREGEMRLLKTKSEDPDVLLQLAFSKIRQWDYAASIPFLEKHIRQSDQYSQLVGRVNLAAAQVHLRKTEEAQFLLERLLEQTKSSGYRRLFSNCLELSVQNALHQGNLKKAEKYLNEITKDSPINLTENLYVQKWKLVLDIKRDSQGRLPSVSLKKELNRVRALAEKLRDFETLRDLDRIEALHWRNADLFLKVYCGTPYQAYKAHLLEEYESTFQAPFQEPIFYEWRRSSLKSIPTQIDLMKGQTSHNTPIKAGQIYFRVITALASDFYKGLEVAAFYDRVFQNEYYNPYTSPNRVHQCVLRTRSFLKKHAPAALIEYHKGQYQIASNGGLSIVIPLQKYNPHSSSLTLVLEKLNSEDFKVTEVATILKCSIRSANRVLSEGVTRKCLQPLGEGRRRRYRVINITSGTDNERFRNS